MEQIWVRLNEGRAKVDSHPFFTWLQSESVPLTSRFIFSPVMIDFIMSFADLNKWFLRYESPDGPLQQSINEHTEEDATHSRLFVQNWENLKLGDTLDWPACKGLWWLFQSPQCQAVRDFGMSVLKLAVSLTDPRVRFCMMEAIEICGDVFFEYTAPIAGRLEAERQGQHIYYGQYHRDRETGHLQSDEGCFSGYELSPQQRALAENAVDVVYRNFLLVLDQLLAFSQRAVADYKGLQREIEEDFRGTLTQPVDRIEGGPAFPRDVSSENVHASQLLLMRRLVSRVQRLSSHSFLAWLTNGRGQPLERLQAFAPVWGIDVVGYKDFNDLVLRYESPATPAEEAVNQLAADLATHGALYLQDWKSLRLDKILGWRMVDVITYYFLSDDTEVHRCNMAKVKKHAMRQDNAVVRWWLMFALEKANQVLFEATRGLAQAAEHELGVTLNFWAYRHGLVESGRTVSFSFPAEPVSADGVSAIAHIIETVFDNFEQQFDLSEAVATSGVFATLPQSLPPPRVSAPVMRTPPDLLPVWASGAAAG